MGILELFLGYFYIPSMLLLLVLLASRFAQGFLHWVITHIINSHLTVNNYRVRILSLLSCINLLYFLSMLMEIQKLNRLHTQSAADPHKEAGLGSQAIYIDRLYKSYRSALMNFTALLLVAVVWFATRKYDQYSRLKAKAKKAIDDAAKAK